MDLRLHSVLLPHLEEKAVWVRVALVALPSPVPVRVEQVAQVPPQREVMVRTVRHIQSREHLLTMPAVAVAVDG